MMHPRTIDLAGKRFGRLHVLQLAARGRHRQTRWLCRCDCGTERTVIGRHLRDGHTKSCGCTKVAASAHGHTKHGEAAGARTTEYRIWRAMKDRCGNPRNKSYRHYGGRGIRVCKRWLDCFDHFLADMGRRPTPNHTLDRKNNDRGYSPSNCRWATWTEQANNRRPRRRKA